MSEDKKTLSETHKAHRDANWPMQNWRSWGSWFSWGSPVGLGIFIALVGVFIWLIKL
jgi:hypothetical protein